MYFFRSSITYNSHFSRDQSKCKFVKLLSTRIKIHQILVTFKTTNQFYFKFCINLQCQETQLICTFIAEILYAFNKRNLSGYKFGSIESLKFGTLMDSFRQNNIKFQLKKDRRSMTLKSDAKFKEKLTCSFKYVNFVNFHPTTQKSKDFTLMGYLYLKCTRFELKKYREVNFHETER